MPDLVYRTFDGVEVTLKARRYEDHIAPRHPDVTAEDIRAALTNPARICDHRTRSMRRVYEGPPRVDYFGVPHFVVVVVGLMSQEQGQVITAYRDTLAHQGAQRWP